MTLKNYIAQHTARQAMFIAVPGLATLLLSWFLPQHPEAWLIAAVLTLIGTPISLLRLRRVTCPRCSVPLGDTALRIVSGSRDAPERCPHCGVSFSEPMQQ
jgi:hypothetical protein